jgi:hypothetical protein
MGGARDRRLGFDLLGMATVGQTMNDRTARHLLEDALFLRMNGERPPGAPKDRPHAETWDDWDVRCESFLRSLTDYLIDEQWNARTAATPINRLVARCYNAIRIDGGEYAEFTISHPDQIDEGWYVGYRNRGDWKDTYAAPTLGDALMGWLDQYEHHYWPGKWEGRQRPE